MTIPSVGLLAFVLLPIIRKDDYLRPNNIKHLIASTVCAAVVRSHKNGYGSEVGDKERIPQERAPARFLKIARKENCKVAPPDKGCDA
jgi:hypothetical protein